MSDEWGDRSWKTGDWRRETGDGSLGLMLDDRCPMSGEKEVGRRETGDGRLGPMSDDRCQMSWETGVGRRETGVYAVDNGISPIFDN